MQRMKTPILKALTAAGLLLASSAFAQEEPIGLSPLRGPIAIRYNPTGQPRFASVGEVSVFINRVVAAWNQACGRLVVAYAGVDWTANDLAHDDGVSTIGWHGRSEKYAGVTVRSGTSKLDEADVMLNPDDLTSWPAFRSVLIHEFGHVVGLEHSEDEASVMHRSIALTDAMSITDAEALQCQALYRRQPTRYAGSSVVLGR